MRTLSIMWLVFLSFLINFRGDVAYSFIARTSQRHAHGALVGTHRITIFLSHREITFTKKSNGGRTSLFLRESDNDSSYSDDCFGLIFLSIFLALGDVLFASIFLGCSALAAVLTQSFRLPFAKSRVPGVVAGVTLLLTLLARPMLTDPSPSNDNAFLLETVVCSFSFVYGVFLKSQR